MAGNIQTLEELPDASSILARHVTAVGGAEALGNLQSLKFTGVGERHGGGPIDTSDAMLVWTADGQRKLCSIGVAARRWVTYHGLALNLSTDLSHFAAIHPCGYDAAVMTSLEKELGKSCPSRSQVVAALTTRLATSLARFRRPA